VTAKTETEAQTEKDKDQDYPLWWALPLQPGPKRVTKRYEVVPGQIYTFEQLLGTLNVIVNQRMTVVVVGEGEEKGLFVHAPIAPTPECLRLMAELEERFGPVKHIVLPTTAVEHKVYLGPFAKKYPKAEIYVAPRQWSFPLNLPLAFLGLFPRKAQVIEEETNTFDWGKEFEISILNLTVGIGPFVEVAFFHKKSKTLLVTDTVFKIPEEPPEVCLDDPQPLLMRSRDNKTSSMANTKENLRKGWWKTILFAIFFQPSSVKFNPLEWPTALVWTDDKWVEKVQSVQNKLLIAPILQVLVFARDPETTLQYLDKICKWRFKRIIPAHFEAPIEATRFDVRRSANFLRKLKREEEERKKRERNQNRMFGLFTSKTNKEKGSGTGSSKSASSSPFDYPESELSLLKGLTTTLMKLKVIN